MHPKMHPKDQRIIHCRTAAVLAGWFRRGRLFLPSASPNVAWINWKPSASTASSGRPTSSNSPFTLGHSFGAASHCGGWRGTGFEPLTPWLQTARPNLPNLARTGAKPGRSGRSIQLQARDCYSFALREVRKIIPRYRDVQIARSIHEG